MLGIERPAAAAPCLVNPGDTDLAGGATAKAWIVSPRLLVAQAVTAALFAIMHVQYEPYVIGQVFVCGALLGWFRWVSGSTLLTILMHGLINLEGMIETMLMQHG